MKALAKANNPLACASVNLSHSLERYYLTLAPLRRVGRLQRWLCRGCLHEAADLLCRASLHIIRDMGVGVQCEARAEVSQHAGQRLRIHPAGQSHGREGVPLWHNKDKSENP